MKAQGKAGRLAELGFDKKKSVEQTEAVDILWIQKNKTLHTAGS